MTGVTVHYFQFHIGDYRAATAHLDDAEDLAYRRLLDMYYDTEQPIPLDLVWVSRRTRMEASVLRDVLNDFFRQTENGWVNDRADAEIAAYKRMSDGGKAGAAKRWSKVGDVNPIPTLSLPQSTPNANQEPITNNHKPKNTATKVAPPDGVSELVWDDFVKHRKAKKAQITQRVIDDIAKQAKLANWTLEAAISETIVRNWQTFKAAWVEQKQGFRAGFDVSKTTVPSRPDRDPALVKAEQDLRNAAPPSLEVLARMARLREGVAK